MTAIRKDAMEMLERIPEEKLIYVIQIMQGLIGLFGETELDCSLIGEKEKVRGGV